MADALSVLLREASQLSLRQFLAKYPHPWLLSEAIKAVQLPAPRGDSRTPSTDAMVQGTIRMLATKPSSLAFRTRSQSFLLFPIVKADRNLWAERILVGRSDNNDIILSDSSVSKAHAYFCRKGTRTQIVAFPTMNPTKVNGTLLNPHGAGVDVPNDSTLEFGLAGCRFILSAALYGFLTG